MQIQKISSGSIPPDPPHIASAYTRYNFCTRVLLPIRGTNAILLPPGLLLYALLLALIAYIAVYFNCYSATQPSRLWVLGSLGPCSSGPGSSVNSLPEKLGECTKS